jgi:uncharacterized protein
VKVFFDTNVLVSALATRGLCAEIFEAVIDEHALVTTDAVLIELDRTLVEKFHLPRATIDDYLELIGGVALLAAPAAAPARNIPDPVDGAIVAAAAGAEGFVTGDQEVRAAGHCGGMQMRTPREFWNLLAGFGGSPPTPV